MPAALGRAAYGWLPVPHCGTQLPRRADRPLPLTSPHAGVSQPQHPEWQQHVMTFSSRGRARQISSGFSYTTSCSRVCHSHCSLPRASQFYCDVLSSRSKCRVQHILKVCWHPVGSALALTLLPLCFESTAGLDSWARYHGMPTEIDCRVCARSGCSGAVGFASRHRTRCSGWTQRRVPRVRVVEHDFPWQPARVLW